MASEYILVFLSKFKFRIIFFSLFLFVVSYGLSYYFTGRIYKASIDFYLINSSFVESINEDANRKLFLSVEEIEIIGSISKSSELFEAVVNQDSLSNYYQCNSNIESIEKLKKNTLITIGKKGKITINVEDYNNKKAHLLANHLMQAIYNSFTLQTKQIRNNTQQDLVYRINYYNTQKEKILTENFTNKNISKDVLEVPLDSLYDYKVLNRIQTKTGLNFKDILNIISNIKRITEIDSKVFALNDQLNKAEQSIQSLNRNNIIVLNNAIPYSKSVGWKEHINESIKYTFLINALWISLLMIYRHYKKEIDLIFGSKKLSN